MSMAWQKEIYCAPSHLTFFLHSEQGTMPIWCFQEITRFFQLLGDLFLPILHILALISVKKLCFLLLLQIHWIIILIFLWHFLPYFTALKIAYNIIYMCLFLYVTLISPVSCEMNRERTQICNLSIFYQSTAKNCTRNWDWHLLSTSCKLYNSL